MAKKAKPETYADEDLDAAQGGVWFENWTGVARRAGPTGSFVNAGGGWDHTLKQPDTQTNAGDEDQ